MSIDVSFIHRQRELLSQQVSKCTDDATAFHNTLICSQHETTSRYIRQMLLQLPPRTTRELRDALTQYVDAIEQTKLPNVIHLESTLEGEQRKSRRRLSIDLHSADGIDEEIETMEEMEKHEDDANLNQLRKRLLDGRSKSSQSLGKAHATFDEQLVHEEKTQEEILQTMSGYLRGLTEGAQAFNEKLNEGKNLVDAASKGLEVTGSKMSKTTGNLKKTVESWGFMTYLWLALYCILAFVFSLVLIAFIPKL